MLIFFENLENRLALPGDSETRRKQKVAALLAGVAGMLIAFVTVPFYAAAGVTAVVWLQLGLGIFMILPVLWLLKRPQEYAFLLLFTAITVTVHPWVVSFYSGGLQSGTFHSFWTIFGPFSAILLLGLGPGAVAAGLLFVCLIVATLLDPLAAARSPEIAQSIRHFLGIFNMVGLSAMILIPVGYLFYQQEEARQRADGLLLNILPAPIAAQLKLNSDLIAERYPDVTVLFADIVDFTHLSAGADPAEVVGLLNHIFSEFDDLADAHGLEKIKTIGDAYMVAGGLPLPREDHCEAVVAFGVEILTVVDRFRAWNGDSVCLRVGIHSGPVVAGVIGHRKFSYDMWGDTVNTASRMEASGLESTIQVTAEVKDKLGSLYEFQERPPVFIKGKGLMTTYLLVVPPSPAPSGAEHAIPV